MRLKYVILDGKLPILFSTKQFHSDFEHVRLNNERGEWERGTATSAGFCEFALYEGSTTCYDVTCYGESTTLGLKATPTDSTLIKQLLES